jgi:hypothetical protein
MMMIPARGRRRISGGIEAEVKIQSIILFSQKKQFSFLRRRTNKREDNLSSQFKLKSLKSSLALNHP